MNSNNICQENEQESQEVEWKWSWQDEYLKWLCGYANADGGTLYIGVNDDGYVVGIEDSKRMLEGLPNKINDKLGIIASINIHKAYGTENLRYGDSVPEDISSKLINKYACGLINTGMLDSSDRSYKSLAAILLFHPTPEQYVTGAYIKIGYFSLVGAFGREAETIEDLQYQDVVEGPLILQVDRAIDLIFTKYFKALVDYEGVQRTETNMLTRGIVRELLLNAINHKDYATGVPIQVSVYEDRIVIFNMGSWSKRVPTDERVYEKHESVPNNPKIADVSFRSGDVEAWGRGFLKIKVECKTINAPLPTIDAENGGVSVSASGCEQYMSILRYGQYGQVGADGVWRNKEKNSKKTGDKKPAIKTGGKKVTKKTQMQYDKILAYMEPEKEYDIWDFCELLDLKESRVKEILKGLSDYLEIVGSNRDRRYKKK